MYIFEAAPAELRSLGRRIGDEADELRGRLNELHEIRSVLSGMSGMDGICSSLDAIGGRIRRDADALLAVGNAAAGIAGLYADTDNQLAERAQNDAFDLTGTRFFGLGDFSGKGLKDETVFQKKIDYRVLRELTEMIV